MVAMLEGVRVLEVAQFIFIPSAGAILAEWGADVLKVEHPVHGDAQRGMSRAGGLGFEADRDPVFAHANRGKRSVGIDLTRPEGQALLYAMAKEADIFLTNDLPAQRQKLKIDVEHIRAHNDQIIYVRGSAHGDKGPEREIGGFDGTSFWARSGIAYALSSGDSEVPLRSAIGGFGDSIGGVSVAGGVAAALYRRAMTGHVAELDVSLMSAAWWAAGVGVNLAAETGQVSRNGAATPGPAPGHPLIGNYLTSDRRVISLFTLQPDLHVRNLLDHLGLGHMADDPRLRDYAALAAHWQEAGDLIAAAIAAQPFDYWRTHLRSYTGQWAPVQSFVDLLTDEQAIANDMLIDVEAIDGGAPMRVVRGPVQFDGVPADVIRAPQTAEHTESVLLEMGMDWDAIAALKAAGIVS